VNIKIHTITMEEYKFYLAKKVISIASACGGYVYGEFVRNVIIPKKIDPMSEISVGNVDIWFREPRFKEIFDQELDRRMINYRKLDERFEYKFVGDYGYSLDVIVIVSKEFPTQNFDVNSIRYALCDGEFSVLHNGSHRIDIIPHKNKKTTMSSNYNPTTDEEFNQINKDFFQKGWSIITDKQTELSKWIIKNNVPVTIGIEDGRWIYSPKKEDTKIYVPSLRIAGIEEDIRRVIKSIYPEYSEEHINGLIKASKADNTNKVSDNNTNINKVSDNVTIKSKWSRDMIEQNIKNNYFIDVGKERVSYRLLSGSTRLWSSYNIERNEIVYILPLRICGTHNDIRTTLKSAEPPYTDNEIDNYLRDAISKYNYQTTKSNEYNQEIADFRSKRKSKNTKWSRDLIRPFAKGKSFARVGRENLTRINLSDASHFWIYNPELITIIFILPLRICGTPDDIRKELRSTEPPYSEDEINNYLKDAITKDNYQTTKADDYNKEIGNPLLEMFELAQKITNDLRNSNIANSDNTNFNTIFSNLIKEITDNPKEDKLKEDKLKEDKLKGDKSQRVGFMTEEADDIPVLKENIMRIVGNDSFYPRNLDDKSKAIKDITGGNVLYLRKEDESKAVMRSIFNAGLEVYHNKINDIKNDELRSIYETGMDEYRNKFNDLIKDM